MNYTAEPVTKMFNLEPNPWIQQASQLENFQPNHLPGQSMIYWPRKQNFCGIDFIIDKGPQPGQSLHQREMLFISVSINSPEMHEVNTPLQQFITQTKGDCFSRFMAKITGHEERFKGMVDRDGNFALQALSSLQPTTQTKHKPKHEQMPNVHFIFLSGAHEADLKQSSAKCKYLGLSVVGQETLEKMGVLVEGI